MYRRTVISVTPHLAVNSSFCPPGPPVVVLVEAAVFPVSPRFGVDGVDLFTATAALLLSTG